ncbi:zinc finger MYM-type protein 1-like [Anoplophora glabripennis]|uniref:zinc finger MYM-type protein 1-like n=1 Tax=Anoplophora glabripennis TaxID=217634 RepID=UPI000C78A30E|nr:zinc finger MYM-type protein 1-like [Anoplophora glabripennis]XP_023312057.1 zinc finger MYM-type protein 1-like [Anoplophora glabripennis]
MLEVCRNKIVTEINQSNYVAVMADEITDVSSKFQMVVVLRYVHEGSPVERFLAFINPEKHDAESLTHSIRSVLDPLLEENCNKLIAQAYDGAAVMSGRHASVYTRIREKYPLAYFVHCYAHQLNLIMSQAVSQNTQVRIFFSIMDDIVNFFSNSPQRLDILTEVVGKRIPRAVQTPWNFKSSAVNIIYEYRTSLIECMQQIQEQFSSAKAINQASAIERLLHDKVFLFWLNIFHNIMPHVDILYNQLQTRITDPVVIKSAIDTFENCINNVRKDIKSVIKRGEELFKFESESAPKRMRVSEESLRASALEVCDVMIQTAKTRFEYSGHLLASTLFFSDHFDKYSKTFPDDVLKTTVAAYPVFEVERLRTELTLIYMRPDFREINGAVAFLNMIRGNNLEQTFKETIKLLEIIITIPMSTAETERCFSTLKRVKNFLRNSVCVDRLSALSMLSIENTLIKNDINFNEKVIEMFASTKQCRIDLVFKK